MTAHNSRREIAGGHRPPLQYPTGRVLQRPPHPHLHHRSPPREIHVGIIQWTGVEPRGVGGGVDTIGGKFSTHERVCGRQGQNRGRCDSADRDSCRLNRFSVLCGTKPHGNIQNRKINRSTTPKFLERSDIAVDARELDGEPEKLLTPHGSNLNAGSNFEARLESTTTDAF
jgi:hypothetical protein